MSLPLSGVSCYCRREREYATQDASGDGIPEFASKFLSSPGKRDGLYWETREDEPLSPVGPLLAAAAIEGANRKLLGGFAILAYPASYERSGVVTFMANQDGIVYQRDLGQNTAALVGEMTEFDPDPSWRRVP